VTPEFRVILNGECSISGASIADTRAIATNFRSTSMTRAFESCHKLTGLDDTPVSYPGVYWREPTTGPERLVVAPKGSCLELVRSLSSAIESDAFLLYVLLVSRGAQQPGRYQTPHLLSQKERDDFLYEFGQALDRDGRHQLWIGAPHEGATLVWDQHQWVFCYGDLPRYEAIAVGSGLSQGVAQLPFPHAHCYHRIFDATVDQILSRFEWIRTDLTDADLD
jgi:hypothetical protein